MKEAEKQHLAATLHETLQEEDSSTSENSFIQIHKDQPVQSDTQTSELEQNQIQVVNVYDSQSEEESNFWTPFRADGTNLANYHSLRDQIIAPRKRLAEAFQSPISRDPRISTTNDFPLASSQQKLRAVPQPMQQTPTELPQLQPAVLAGATESGQPAGLPSATGSGPST